MLSVARASCAPLRSLLCVGVSSAKQNSARLLLVQVVKPNVARNYARGTQFAGRTANTGFGTRTAPGKTLKERLLGPTTGTPYKIGSLATAGAAAVGVGALCFYGLGLSNETGILEKSALVAFSACRFFCDFFHENAIIFSISSRPDLRIWPDYVSQRIHSTYMYLGGSLMLTAASAAAVARNPAMLRMMTSNSMLAMFGSLAAVIGTGMLVRSVPYSPGIGAKQLAWIVHTGTLGAVLAPLCFLGGPLLIRAAVYTAGIVGGLSAVAVCAPSEKFLNMAGPLSMGLGVVFVSSIGTWFLPPTTALGAGLMSIAMYGGLILFSGFLLYDTQAVVKKAEYHPPYSMVPFDPINAQIGIYLDIINIFMRIAMIMSGQRIK